MSKSKLSLDPPNETDQESISTSDYINDFISEAEKKAPRGPGRPAFPWDSIDPAEKGSPFNLRLSKIEESQINYLRKIDTPEYGNMISKHQFVLVAIRKELKRRIEKIKSQRVNPI
jgi:hypothetical protein